MRIKKLNFTVVIHELILPILDDANYVSPKNRKKNTNNSDENEIPKIQTTNALRELSRGTEGNKKSGVTRSIVAKPYSYGRPIDGANASFEEEEEQVLEKHDFRKRIVPIRGDDDGKQKEILTIFNTRSEQERSGSTERRGEESGGDARRDGGLRFEQFSETGTTRREDGREGDRRG